jgi:hypothetical protein
VRRILDSAVVVAGTVRRTAVIRALLREQDAADGF